MEQDFIDLKEGDVIYFAFGLDNTEEIDYNDIEEPKIVKLQVSFVRNEGNSMDIGVKSRNDVKHLLSFTIDKSDFNKRIYQGVHKINTYRYAKEVSFYFATSYNKLKFQLGDERKPIINNLQKIIDKISSKPILV